MGPDLQAALVEEFRVRIGAVIDDVYETIAATATSMDEVNDLHRLLLVNVITLAAFMHLEVPAFSEQGEKDFLALARHARSFALAPGGE